MVKFDTPKTSVTSTVNCALKRGEGFNSFWLEERLINGKNTFKKLSSSYIDLTLANIRGPLPRHISMVITYIPTKHLVCESSSLCLNTVHDMALPLKQMLSTRSAPKGLWCLYNGDKPLWLTNSCQFLQTLVDGLILSQVSGSFSSRCSSVLVVVPCITTVAHAAVRIDSRGCVVNSIGMRMKIQNWKLFFCENQGVRVCQGRPLAHHHFSSSESKWWW